jgi:hypothetical protein
MDPDNPTRIGESCNALTPYALDIYPLVICSIAIEHGPFIVDLPSKNDDFP